MIIGDPYRFALIFDEVKEWCYGSCNSNGHFAFCMDGKMLPGNIINAVNDNALAKVLDKLKNAPEDSELFAMDAAPAFEKLYDLVYPTDSVSDNDYRFELAPEEVIDEGYHVFLVRSGDTIRILGAHQDYDREQSRHIFEGIEISEAVIDRTKCDEIVSRIEEYLGSVYGRFTDHLDDNTVRIIKIDEEALFEFLYESFIDKHEAWMNADAVECANDFAVDWEKRTFIFAAKKGEDENGNFLPFPKDINLKEIMRKIPATTTTVFTGERIYRDYTFDELRKL